jgi:hypothetical protein
VKAPGQAENRDSAVEEGDPRLTALSVNGAATRDLAGGLAGAEAEADRDK